MIQNAVEFRQQNLRDVVGYRLRFTVIILCIYRVLLSKN